MSDTFFPDPVQPWRPHLYQKKSVKFLLEHAAAGLLLDPGLGKTSVTLAAIKFLKERGLLRRVLLLAPLRVCYSVWPKEQKKWEDFAGLKISLVHGPKKAEALEADADIYVINYEGLEWLLQAEKTRSNYGRTKVGVDLRRWRKFEFDTLVIDELSRLKHTNTVRFKMLKQVIGTFSRRWGLTGSPVPNGLMDLFGQMYMLDQGRSLGPYITHYRLRYFTQGYDGFSWELREGADQEIYERIAPLTLRLAAEDYISMPQLIENNIYIDLPEAVAEVYDRLENDLIARIDQRLVVASNAGAASTKCRQVANGGVYLDPELTALLKPKAKREWADLHTGKVDAVIELLEELQGAPLLVAYDFEHDLARLKARLDQWLGYETPYIGGGVSGKKAAELEQLWNAGKLPVLLGHPQSIGHGLNLQEAGCHVCWHSLTWDYDNYDQFIRRVWRQGNKAQRVFVHHLIARGTIDEQILEVLKLKRTGQNALFAALTELAKKRKR